MIKNYATMEIRKSARETKDITNYYILEEEKFGLKILRNSNSEGTKEEEVIIHNISEKEEFVENIIDTIIQNNSDISQLSYVIEDLLSQDKIKSDLKNESEQQSLV